MGSQRYRVIRGPNGRTRTVMRMLADNPAGLTCPQIQEHLNVQAVTRTAALTKIGSTLREQYRQGRVMRGGWLPGGYQMPPTLIWKIAPAGLAWLKLIETARDARQADIQERLLRAAGRAADRARCAQLVSAAAADYGPQTPRHTRIQVAAALRAERCTLKEIGGLFGVTREAVRKMLEEPAAAG